jgi:hypothetical protein
MQSVKASVMFAAVLGATVCTSARTASAHLTKARTQACEEASALPSGAALFAELDSTMDSKKVKSGDAVTAHTTREIKYNGKVILPRNTKLVGHVTQASAKSKGDPESTLAIQFDKALPKKEPEIPLKVVLRAIAAQERYAPTAGPAESTSNAGSIGTQTSPMGSPPRSPMPGSAPTPAAGAARSGNDAGAEGGAGAFNDSSRGVVGIDGLQLTPADSSSAEKGALLVGSGKSVHLDAGTRLLFSVQ